LIQKAMLNLQEPKVEDVNDSTDKTEDVEEPKVEDVNNSTDKTDDGEEAKVEDVNDSTAKTEDGEEAKAEDVNDNGSENSEEWEVVPGNDADEESKEQDPEVIIAEASVHKDEGNNYYKSGELGKAAIAYRKGAALLEVLNLDNTGEEEVKSLILKINSNLSIVWFNLKNYKESRDAASKALEVNPISVKALFRRAVAYRNLKEFEAAEEDLKLALEHDPENTAVQKEITAIVKDAETKKIDMEIEKKANEAIMGRQTLWEKRKAEWTTVNESRVAKGQDTISFADYRKEITKVEIELKSNKEKEDKEKAAQEESLSKAMAAQEKIMSRQILWEKRKAEWTKVNESRAEKGQDLISFADYKKEEEDKEKEPKEDTEQEPKEDKEVVTIEKEVGTENDEETQEKEPEEDKEIITTEKEEETQKKEPEEEKEVENDKDEERVEEAETAKEAETEAEKEEEDTKKDAKLYYYPATGRGHAVRLSLAAAGITFEDVGPETFPPTAEERQSITKIGGNTTTNLPMLVFPNEDKVYCQSRSVLRVIGRRGNLLGNTNDDEESYMVDKILCDAEDLRTEAYKTFANWGANKHVIQKYIYKVFPQHLQNLERQLLLNESSPYFVGDELTVADISVYDVVVNFGTDRLGSREILLQLPALKWLVDTVEAEEGIAKYMASEQFKKIPKFGPESLLFGL